MPYHHAKFDFFAPVLFLHRFIQDDVEEDLKVYRQQYFEGGKLGKALTSYPRRTPITLRLPLS